VPRREKSRRSRVRSRRPEPADETIAHGIWSGSLSFGLVTVPVELYSARRRSPVALRMVSPAGHPLERRYVCPAEDRPLEADEIVRGYPLVADKFVVIEDEELEALAPRRSRDIEITRFVERDAIDPAFFERAYYMVPAREQTKAYGVLAEAMEKSRRAAIAHFVMREKAYAVAIFADRGLLRAETLRFAEELRTARSAGLPRLSKVDPRRVRKMRDAIEAKARTELVASELRDEETERLLALGREKLARREDVVDLPAEGDLAAEEAGGEVIDLVALLKRQLGSRSSSTRPRRKASARAGGGRRKR